MNDIRYGFTCISTDKACVCVCWCSLTLNHTHHSKANKARAKLVMSFTIHIGKLVKINSLTLILGIGTLSSYFYVTGRVKYV